MRQTVYLFVFLFVFVASVPWISAQETLNEAGGENSGTQEISNETGGENPAAEEISDRADVENSTAQETENEAREELSDSTEKFFEKVNDSVQKIYDNIVAVKEKYKELSAFDANCLSRNEAGFLKITYETQIPAGGGKTAPYGFTVEVLPIKKKTYSDQLGYFYYPLPMLELKFAGFVNKHPYRRQFDPQIMIDKLVEDLSDYQQQFMPLRFYIIPEKEIYKVNEPIRFKAVLANVSKQNMLVKKLSRDTLYFTLNDNFWGTQQGDVVNDTRSAREIAREQRQLQREARAKAREEARRLRRGEGMQTIRGKITQVGDNPILRADEALAVNFVGEGYKKPQEVAIRGTYQLNVKGLKPTNRIILKIVP